MSSLVVGTAGHIDHGKSTLVQGLTGIDPDRLKEEKARGITIELGFAHAAVGDAHLAFVDVPGHERFVRTMLAGAGGIDFVMLVVAADERHAADARAHYLPSPRRRGRLCRHHQGRPPTRDAGAGARSRRPRGRLLSDNKPVIPVSARTGAGSRTFEGASRRGRTGAAPSADGIVRLPIDQCSRCAGSAPSSPARWFRAGWRWGRNWSCCRRGPRQGPRHPGARAV